MIDNKCITRKYIIKGVNVTIKPFYTLGSFGGYIATAGNTSKCYPEHLTRRFYRFTSGGLDHATTAENIAYDFIDYYYPATKNNYLEV